MSSWRRRARPIVTMVIALTIPGIIVALYLGHSYPATPGPGSGREVTLDIPWGASPSRIARHAADVGVVRHPRAFALYLRLSGKASELKAGRHVLIDDWSPAEVALALTHPGAAEQVRITFPEGTTRFDMAEALDKRGVVSREAFLSASSDPDLLRKHRIIGQSAEGYLYPETYHWEPGTEPDEVVIRLLEAFDRHVGKRLRSNQEVLIKLGDDLTALEEELEREGPLSVASSEPALAGQHAVVILASMIEAETARQDERPQVAAVILNRLLSPGFPSRKLQIDPTVRYGCLAEPHAAPTCQGWEGGLLSTRHLQDEKNKYNTYIIRGLPPSPIGNPSKSSIEAALSPAKTNAIFFVADGKGGHVFSKTLEEHNKAVKAYRAQ